MNIKIDHQPKEKKSLEEICKHLEEHGWEEHHKKDGGIVITLGCPPLGCPPCDPNC